MIQFTEILGQDGLILNAHNRGVSIRSSELGPTELRQQALFLIDAAASLIEHDDECRSQFEKLHDVMESLPAEFYSPLSSANTGENK